MDGRGIVYGYGEKRVEGSRFVEGEGALRACVREVRGLIWGGEAEEYSESFAGVGFLNRFSIGFWFWMLAVNVVCRLAVAGLVGFFPEKQCSVFLGVQYGCRQVSLPTWFRLLRMLAHGGWSRVAVGMLLATVYGRWERRFRGEGRVESAAVVAVSMVPVAVVAGHAGADVVTPVALVAGFDAVAREGKATRGVAWAAVAMGCAWALCPCRGLLPAVAVSVVALRRWRTRRPWKVPEVEKSPSELGAIAPGVQWSGEALKEVQRMVETTTVDPGWPAVRVKAQMGDRLLGFMVAQVVEDEKGVPADVSRVERELLSNASMTRYMHIACPEWWARTGVSMHGDAAATVYEAVWGCASGWFFSLPSTVQLKVARRVMKRLSETSGVEVSLPPDS